MSLGRQAATHGDRLWERDPDECCRLRKVDPLTETRRRRGLGVRRPPRTVPGPRTDARKLAWDAKHERWKANPLADWSEEDVWRYIHHDLPYNPLHDRGYASIGCTHCTKPGAGREGAGRTPARPSADCTADLSSPNPIGLVPPPMTHELSYLRLLEAEAVFVMREVAAEFERPVLLFSGGKDSIVLLRLAEEGVPARASRSRSCTSTPGTTSPRCSSSATAASKARGAADRRLGAGVDRRRSSAGRDRGRRVAQPPRYDASTAIAAHRFDAALGGARRDEERARAKERVFSFRDDLGQWDPKGQRPGWNLYNGRVRNSEHVHVFPLSNWTELDVWLFTPSGSSAVDLLRARPQRDRARRHAAGGLRARPPPRPRDPFEATVRYRTVGDMAVTGAVRSYA